MGYKILIFEVERGEVLGILEKNGAESLLYSRYYHKRYSTYNRKHKIERTYSLIVGGGTGFNGEMTVEKTFLERTILGMTTKKEITQN
jgi:ABC-type polysaccharide/polyol phosphate transport system ATPase subunit